MKEELVFTIHLKAFQSCVMHRRQREGVECVITNVKGCVAMKIGKKYIYNVC